jgi:hypothetical protein
MASTTLSTVADYVADSRTLLQDTVQPYRYPDADLVEALNMAWLEAARLRPDLALDAKYQGSLPRRQAAPTNDAPTFTTADMSVSAQVPQPYRQPFLYFMVGQAQLRDTEDTQDGRASAFLSKFVTQLLSIAS